MVLDSDAAVANTFPFCPFLLLDTTGYWRSSDKSRDALTTLDTWFLNRANANCSCFFNFAGDQTLYPTVVVSSESYSCIACTKGQFRAGHDPGSTCKLCPPGKSQDLVGQSSCVACAPGYYQNKAGAKTCRKCSGYTFQLYAGATSCTTCPFGADCPNGGLVAKRGYYGTPLSAGLESFRFFLCPMGYCVEDNFGGGDGAHNATYAQCKLGANRDWNVPLCGACLPGFSQSISSANCVPNDSCTATMLWFWPAVLLYCLIYAVFFLSSSSPVQSVFSNVIKAVSSDRQLRKKPGCRAWLARKAEAMQNSRFGAALAGGSINVLAFFFQMATIVLPANGATASFGAELKTFFGGQMDSNGGSSSNPGDGRSCIWKDMSSFAKIAMHYVIPLLMVVVLRVLVACAPWLPQDLRNLRARFPGALAQLLLIAYTTLTTTTLQLLKCTKMPSGERVLFFAGATKCGAWQAPLFALLMLLVLLPAVPLLVFCVRLLPSHWPLVQEAQKAHFPTHPTVQALRLSLTRMFVPEYWHWPALLALQRFAMVATPIFVNDTLKSSVVLAFIVFFMQNLQLSFAPYANADVNMHQKLASDCLLALALLVVPLRVLAQASVDVDAPGQEPLKRACDGLGTAMAPFLLAPILLPLLAMAAKSLLKGTGAAWRARAATASKRRATRSTTTVAADAGMLDNPGVDQGVDVEPRKGSAAEAHNAL
jgi:hypothetical protein